MGKVNSSNSLVALYYELTKPGIVRSNSIVTAAVYVYALRTNFSLMVFAALLFGTGCIIACGCVINNVIDVSIDKQMERTKRRPIVAGKISIKNALVFATLLGVLGAYSLLVYVNTLTMLVSMVGLFAYVVPYSYFKRHSVHGTLVGTISGAMPPVAGVTAATGHLGILSLLLFLLLVVWQMPHFYAIAMFRAKDYSAAKIPVLPVVKGMRSAKRYIVLYVLGFYCVSIIFIVNQKTLLWFNAALLALGLSWLYKALLGFKNGTNSTVWARGVFGVSLVVMLGFNALLFLQGVVK